MVTSKLKITHYTFGSAPEEIPLGGQDATFWPEDADEIILACGENPGDSDLVFVPLAGDWQRHAAGATVLVGLTVEGGAFHVIDEEGRSKSC